MAKLLDSEGLEILKGTYLKDFRGKDWEYLGLTQFNTKVYVKDPPSGTTREFYPAVFKVTIQL